MAFEVDFPLVNGHRHSWASITVKLIGDPIKGITGIDYDSDHAGEDVMGAGSLSLGTTEGEYKPSGKLTLLLEESYQLISALGNGFMLVHFDIEVSFKSAPFKVHTDSLIGCKLGKFGATHAVGPSALARSADLSISRIKYDGFTPYREPIK